MRSKATEKSVVKILGKVKSKHMELARSDVINLLRAYRGLSPFLDTFVFDNGDERCLAKLAGTIPVLYKSATYNIPVCLWLRPDHPNSAPIAFVTPTKDMQIKVSHHVDTNGKIYLPYLEEWRYPDSTLIGLIEVCKESFGEIPPVFSKPKAPPSGSGQRRVSSGDTCAIGTTPASASGQVWERRQDLPGSAENRTPEEASARLSLVQSVEKRVKFAVDEECCKTAAEIESLHITSKELLDGQEEIGRLEKELDQKLQQAETLVSELRQCESALNEVLSDVEKGNGGVEFLKTLDVDSGIVGVESTVHQQILAAQAEDSAIEDVVYMLGEALRLGQLPCEVYLKRVRHLSRKQFFARALMDKCRHISGLDEPQPGPQQQQHETKECAGKVVVQNAAGDLPRTTSQAVNKRTSQLLYQDGGLSEVGYRRSSSVICEKDVSTCVKKKLINEARKSSFSNFTFKS